MASCRQETTPEPSREPATKTLQPLPTHTKTATQPAPSAEETPLVPSEPSATPFVHEVREGDTLLSIALTYGVSFEDLVLVNPGIDPQFLSVGTSLRIPGPEGEAVDVLLPTPTAMAVNLSTVRCFEALTGTFRCLSTLINDLSVPIEAVSGIIGLYDEQGNLLTQGSTENILQFLAPGKRMPLAVVFSKKPPDYAYAEIQILSAIQVNMEGSRFVPVDVELQGWDEVDNGAGAKVEARIILSQDLEQGRYALRLLGMAIDEDDEIVGYRLIEDVFTPDNSESPEMEFFLISLGPPINEVRLVAELSRID
ncbi:MAG: LysM peptidoglycan-binding domain-containing protein [Anaerolineales bacterium]